MAAVEAANKVQKQILPTHFKGYFGENLVGQHFALWGLAFKAETDGMREAASRVLINEFLQACATISAYDPVAIPEATHIYFM